MLQGCYWWCITMQAAFRYGSDRARKKSGTWSKCKTETMEEICRLLFFFFFKSAPTIMLLYWWPLAPLRRLEGEGFFTEHESRTSWSEASGLYATIALRCCRSSNDCGSMKAGDKIWRQWIGIVCCSTQIRLRWKCRVLYMQNVLRFKWRWRSDVLYRARWQRENESASATLAVL